MRQQTALLAVTTYNRLRAVPREGGGGGEGGTREGGGARGGRGTAGRRASPPTSTCSAAQVDLENARTQILRLRGESDLPRAASTPCSCGPSTTPITPDRRPRVRGCRPRPRRRGRGSVVEPAGGAGHRPLPSRSPSSSSASPRRDLRPSLDVRRRLRLVGPPAPELLRERLLEVELRVRPEDPGLRRLPHRGEGRAGPGRPGQDRPRTGSPSRTRSASRRRKAVDRLRVARSPPGDLRPRRDPGPEGARHDQANYKFGAASILDVLDAQAALTQAESNRSGRPLHPRQRPGDAPLRDGARSVSPAEAAPLPPNPPATPPGSRSNQDRKDERPRRCAVCALAWPGTALALVACGGPGPDRRPEKPRGVPVRTAASLAARPGRGPRPHGHAAATRPGAARGRSPGPAPARAARRRLERDAGGDPRRARRDRLSPLPRPGQGRAGVGGGEPAPTRWRRASGPRA